MALKRWHEIRMKYTPWYYSLEMVLSLCIILRFRSLNHKIFNTFIVISSPIYITNESMIPWIENIESWSSMICSFLNWVFNLIKNIILKINLFGRTSLLRMKIWLAGTILITRNLGSIFWAELIWPKLMISPDSNGSKWANIWLYLRFSQLVN